MIKGQEINIKISSSNITHYKNKGYKCNIKDIILVKINDMTPQSTNKIIAICDICGKEKEVEYRRYVNNVKNKNFYVCSLSCAQSKIKLTKKENFGDPNFSNIEKRNNTCEKLYGNKNYKNIEKQKITNLEKYGQIHVINNIEILEKRKKTNIDKFGFDSPMKNVDVKKQRKNTLLNKYGNENYNNINKTLNSIKEKNINNLKLKFNLENVIDYNDQLFLLKCEKDHNYKISYDLIYRRKSYNNTLCTICNPIGVKNSDCEKSLINFIKNNYDLKIIENSRDIIKPYELDIYLPDLKLAFEFNGLFWHSELYRDKKYHRNKFEMCEKKGIQLIQIWEDDWLFKENIVKSMILNKLNKIVNKNYARKCEIREIEDNALIRDFLVENHIQGFAGSKVKLGLFFNNDLVSIMTFLKRKNNIYEINRFCNKLNFQIIGGASKLFKYFINNYKYDEIISFSNNSYSNGNLYNLLGFIKKYDLKEDYSYIKDRKRCHKFNFRKYNQKETEREIMLQKNILRIYDAGKRKFTYPL